MAEGAPLLRAYTLIAYRGFESLLLRQKQKGPCCKAGAFLFLVEQAVWTNALGSTKRDHRSVLDGVASDAAPKG